MTNQQEKFQVAVENMLDAFGIYKAIRDDAGKIVDFRITYVNQAACEINQLSKEEQIGKRLCELIPGNRTSGLFEAYCRVVETRVSYSTEIARYSDPEKKHLTGKAFEIQAAYYNDGFVASWRDITVKKIAEASLQRINEQYRSVVQDQTDVISRFKPDGTFTFVSDTYCRFFDISPEIVGKKWETVAYDDDVPAIDRRLENLNPENPVVTIENRVICARGNLCWMQFVNRGFFDETGRLVEIQSVGRDITELKEKEEMLRQKENSLIEKSEELSKVNNALEVLLERRNKKLQNLQERVYRHFKKTILPDLVALQQGLAAETIKKSIPLIITNLENLLLPDTPLLSSDKYGLTKTELKIANMIINDMTSSEIGEHLNISPNTLGFHRKNIRKKLGIKGLNTSIADYLHQHN